MKIERCYTILTVLVVLWVASLTLVVFPTLGLTTPVFPPNPIYTYQLMFLVFSAVIAAGYSASLGINHLYPTNKIVAQQ